MSALSSTSIDSDAEAYDENQKDSLAEMGPAIRELRKSRNMTLAELALGIERSIGFLSEIERGMTQPILKDVYAIADVFQVPISWFFDRNSGDTPDEQRNIVRAQNRRWMENDNIRIEVLSPRLGEGIEFMKSTYAPLAETKDISMRKSGKETGVVLSGRLELWIDGVKHDLAEGDSYALDISQRFFSKNPSDECETVLYWTVCH